MVGTVNSLISGYKCYNDLCRFKSIVRLLENYIFCSILFLNYVHNISKIKYSKKKYSKKKERKYI